MEANHTLQAGEGDWEEGEDLYRGERALWMIWPDR